MFTMLEDQGGMPEASRTTLTTTSIKVKMERHHNGLRCQISSYGEGEQFDLGHRRSMDQVGAFYSNQEYTHDGSNGGYLPEGDCTTTWSSNINYVKSRFKICI